MHVGSIATHFFRQGKYLNRRKKNNKKTENLPTKKERNGRKRERVWTIDSGVGSERQGFRYHSNVSGDFAGVPLPVKTPPFRCIVSMQDSHPPSHPKCPASETGKLTFVISPII